MSDKRFQMLDPLDQRLRRELPVCDSSGIQVRIEKVLGFELFNTRPYHNYETWSDGYRVVGPIDARGWSPWQDFATRANELGLDADASRELWRIATGSMQRLVVVEREDLDDALADWFSHRAAVREILAEDPPTENQRTRLAVLGYHYDPEEAS